MPLASDSKQIFSNVLIPISKIGAFSALVLSVGLNYPWTLTSGMVLFIFFSRKLAITKTPENFNICVIIVKN